MSLEIRVPQLPESVADATLVVWHKQPGESVNRDENLADLETDKVMLEVPAPVSGVVRELKVQNGTTVKSGELLAILDEGAAATTATAAASTGAASDGPAAAEPDAPAPSSGATRAGPAARRVLAESQLSAAAVAGSAAGGRITKSDALQAAGAAPAAAKPASARGKGAPSAPTPSPAVTPATPAARSPASTPAVPSPPARGQRVDRRVPMTRLRARVAERMVQAQSTQALLTTFNEVDLQRVQGLRARYKELFEKKHAVKLGFMGFFVRAAVEALKRYPILNAAVDGSDIVYHEYFDIGVAVSTDRGLMVPVLRDADALGIAEIEQAIAGYAARARSGSITLEDLTGGTFSITNGGVFGSLMSTPIVNAPQSAILGMHKIQERPMAIDGQVLVRPMMYLAVTYDHRIIDGREAVQFLVSIKESLEDPSRLLLGV